MNYIFKTTATMKEYNNKKWWIDGDIISDMRINADSVENALEIYRERVEEKHYISISRNAIKNKSEMFVDTPDGGAKDMLSRAKRNLTRAIIPGTAHNILICG